MEITSSIPTIEVYYVGFDNEGERKGKELKESLTDSHAVLYGNTKLFKMFIT